MDLFNRPITSAPPPIKTGGLKSENNSRFPIKTKILLGTVAAIAIVLAVVVAMVITSAPSSNQKTGTQNGPVNFVESGLPTGVSWFVSCNGESNYSARNTIVINSSSPGCSFMTFDVNVNGTVYYPNITNGTIVQGRSQSIGFIKVNYTNVSRLSTTRFMESGLPQNLGWSTVYDGIFGYSPSPAIYFNTTAGNYSFVIEKPSVNQTIYFPNPSSGYLVTGSTKYINFTQQKYITYFIESGLPTGTRWNVSYDNSPNSSVSREVSFTTLRGTYSFIVYNISTANKYYVPSVYSGTVASGSTVAIAFTVKNQTVVLLNTTFTESGLPTGYKWNVTYGGVHKSSFNSKILFSTLAGIYAYTIATPSNSSGNCTTVYSPSHTIGNTTAGSSLLISFSGSTTCKSLTSKFIESSLPSGARWSVNYSSESNSSSSATITFSTGPGNFSFLIKEVSSGGYNYAPNPSSGRLKAGNSQYIVFNKIPPPQFTTTFTETGLPPAHGGMPAYMGYLWNVTYDGIPNSSHAPNNITFDTVSGAFSFSIPTLGNGSVCRTTYTPSPASGSITSGNLQSIVFSNSTICVTTFTETGLPNGGSPQVPWNVTYDGVDNQTYMFPGGCVELCHIPYYNTSINFVTSAGNHTYSVSIAPSTPNAAGLYGYTDKNISNSGQPLGIAFDNYTNQMFVADYVANKTAIINITTNSVVKNITGFINPYKVVFDPLNKYIYVSDSGTGKIAVVNTTTDKIIKNISIPSGNYGLSFDPANNEIWSAQLGSISVINATSNKNIENMSLPYFPNDAIDLVYAASNGYIYASMWSNGVVGVINTTTYKVVKNITVGNSPWGIAYDPTNKEVYVANFNSNTTSVINTTTNTNVKTINIKGSPTPIIYGGNGIYVLSYNSAYGDIISDYNNSVIGTFYDGYNTTLNNVDHTVIGFMAEDTNTGNIYLTDSLQNITRELNKIYVPSPLLGSLIAGSSLTVTFS